MSSSPNTDVKRVAHLTSVHQYNDPRIFHKQCRSLAQAGFEVFLVAPIDEEKQENGVRVVPVGRWKNRIHRLLVTVPRVLVTALRLRAQVYQIHDPELLGIAQVLRLTGAEVVYDIHEDYVTSVQQKQYLPKPLRSLLSVAMTSGELLLSLGMKRIIAEKYYEERFPQALKILNYPLRDQATPVPASAAATSADATPVETVEPVAPVVPSPTATTTEEATAAEDNFDDAYSWYLYTGNVTLDRGALTHLNLLAANPRAAVCYVGRCTPYVAGLIRQLAEDLEIDMQRIRIIGEGEYVSREVIAALTSMDHWVAGLALFPDTPHYRRKELTKFFEYMESGLPILASDFAAWTDMIDGLAGYTVNVLDAEALLQRSQALEADATLRQKFGDYGRRMVSQEYNWNNQAETLVGFYRELV